MDDAGLFKQIDRLIAAARSAAASITTLKGVQAQICDFLRTFAGQKSAFYEAAQARFPSPQFASNALVSILENFREYTMAGLRSAISPARQVQLDVVHDFLVQAQRLLETKAVHPAAPIVLVGATLEEYLRTWVEVSGLSIEKRKPSLDAYAQTLLSARKINTQDMKDITSWAGLRNLAAHGEWAEVEDRKRAALMLEGVNLFMRKHESKET